MMSEQDRNKKKFQLSQIVDHIKRCDDNVEIFTKKADEQRRLKEDLIGERVTLEMELL